ncbi:MAG: class I SAM-dependent methyltransferase, partial [Burkholderiales bacterium]
IPDPPISTDMSTDESLQNYYARRAAEYERIYGKPERQADLARLRADAYALPAWPVKFSACFAGFWWSHIPHGRLDAFLAGLHARLAAGARAVFLDNRYVGGSSTPLARADTEGNTYQRRRLADGSEHQVLKNFPTAAEVRAQLGACGHDAGWHELEHYWYVAYRTGFE